MRFRLRRTVLHFVQMMWPAANDVAPCGAQIKVKIRCGGCSRIVMMDRADFMKRMKKIVGHSDTPIRGTNETDLL